MSSTILRLWTILRPPQPAKSSNAIRFGLLGASNIAPIALINPAKSHPEVIVAAVAARDKGKAQTYANKHGIPIVHTSYQDLIDDPAIDAVYIPLPNGLHFEWALKALKAGKHVLLEKPSTSNAEEAELLFRAKVLGGENAPVLLEAFHTRFHPGFQTFLGLLDKEKIMRANVVSICPPGAIPEDDIRFKYHLAGGALMDLGTYAVLCLRTMFGTEPEACIEAIPRIPYPAEPHIDNAFEIKWKFPNGGIGGLKIDYFTSFFSLMHWVMPKAEAVHREQLVADSSLPGGHEHVTQKTVTMWNFLMATLWHRIDVVTAHTVRNVGDKKVVRTWKESEYHKAYTWPKETGRAGEDWWLTYRYELEEFVNRIKGREGSGVWMDGEDSIKHMQMIDSGYERAGMPLRATSSYR